MEPPLNHPKTVEYSKAAGLQPLNEFFRIEKVGRPNKSHHPPQGKVKTTIRKKNRGHVSGAKKPPPPKRNSTATVIAMGKPPPNEASYEILAKKTRNNWGKGEPLERIEKAVEEWFAKSGQALDYYDEEVTLSVSNGTISIPYNTLQTYVTKNDEARRTIGASVGMKPLLDRDTQICASNILVWLDRANSGMDPAQYVDLVQELNPELYRKQSSQSFNRTLLKNHPNVLKPKPKVAKATTTKRCAITLPQQYRWQLTFDRTLDELRQRNTGGFRLTGEKIENLFITSYLPATRIISWIVKME